MKSANEENSPPNADEVLCDPAASHWLKNALHAALLRDPVDAANDAGILARLLDKRVRDLLEQSGAESDR